MSGGGRAGPRADGAGPRADGAAPTRLPTMPEDTQVTMRFGAQLWSQHTTWPEFRDAALLAEQVGWDGVWTWDHLLAIFGPWEQPIFEGWTTLSAVAAVTSRIRLGLMV